MFVASIALVALVTAVSTLVAFEQWADRFIKQTEE